MRSPALLLCTFALFSCAGARPLPPGDELEDPAQAQRESPGSIPTPAQATTDELEQAFEEPQEAKPAESRPNAPSSPNGATNGNRGPAPSELLSQARGALKRKSAEEAEAALSLVDSLGDELEAKDAQQLAELSFHVAVLRGDGATARKHAERWLLRCGPERVDACRSAALSASVTAAKVEGGTGAKAKERMTNVRQYDSCLRQAEARAPVDCLEGALAAYRRMGDRLMIARAQLAKGLKLASEPGHAEEALSRVGQAEGACKEKRCAAVRRRALKLMAQLHLRRDEVRPAAAAMLKEMDLSASTLPEPQRLYARTADVEKICNRLDSAQDEGTCRKLELQLLGRHTFRDFSRGSSSSDGLSPAQVKAVNEHYAVTLRPCLEAEASRLKPPAVAKYTVQWTVTNDGRVENARLERKDKDEGPFGECLREGFRIWRYPQYRGERQHVEQAFELQARERRSAR